jgi:hypothetical protein
VTESHEGGGGAGGAGGKRRREAGRVKLSWWVSKGLEVSKG